MSKFFTTKQITDITLVKFLFSELSFEDAEEFKKEFYALITEPQNKFIINMQKCAFISSMGIGILVSFAAKVREKGGKAVLCCMKREVAGVFRITKLDTIFESCATEDGALNFFK